MKRIILAIVWICTFILAVFLGRFYPSYSFLFMGHGSDIVIGIVTGIIVSIGSGIVSKALSEKKDLTIAIQEYERYCHRIRNQLDKFEDEDFERKMLGLINEDPFYYGFCFTDSMALREMNRKIEELELDLLSGSFEKKSAYNYKSEFCHIRLDILKANYKFYLLGKKRLVKSEYRKAEDGDLFVRNTYRHM